MVHKHVFGKLRCKLINKKITYDIYRYLIIKDLWCHVTVMFSGSNDLDSRPFSERRVEEMRRPQRSDNENKHWQPRWQDLTGHDTSKMLAMYFPHKISQNKVLKKYPCKTCGTLIDVNNPNRRCDTTWYDLLYLLSWSPRHGPICTLLRTVLGSKDACATSKQKPSKTSHLASMSYERYV
jgi:hypothetical protein